MPDYDWRPFLEKWSKAVLASEDVPYYNLPPSAINSEWLGYPGASEDEIAAVEKRLGRTLPPSYRSFLKASNGWMQTGHFIDDLWPVDQLEWHRNFDPQSIAIWSESDSWDDLPYERRGSYRIAEVRDFKSLASTLQISDRGDAAILLLNPERVGADGEWEAWFMASWIPGAYRFPSFWEMAQFLYSGLLEATAHDNRRSKSNDDLIDKLPNLIAELQAKIDMMAQFPYQPGGGTDYHHGMAEGLREAQSLIRQVGQEYSNPAELRVQLRKMAKELNQQSRFKVGNILSMMFNMNKMLDTIHEGGKREGYRQAAGIIGWFLDD
jgi:hypothetical protein